LHGFFLQRNDFFSELNREPAGDMDLPLVFQPVLTYMTNRCQAQIGRAAHPIMTALAALGMM
jgi:hypothetical protein